jgi:hypothetical protein
MDDVKERGPYQPDGLFPIFRTGSQHADDSMRSEGE